METYLFFFNILYSACCLTFVLSSITDVSRNKFLIRVINVMCLCTVATSATDIQGIIISLSQQMYFIFQAILVRYLINPSVIWRLSYWIFNIFIKLVTRNVLKICYCYHKTSFLFEIMYLVSNIKVCSFRRFI